MRSSFSLVLITLLAAGLSSAPGQVEQRLGGSPRSLLDEGDGWGTRKLLRVEHDVAVITRSGVSLSSLDQSLLGTSAPLAGYKSLGNIGSSTFRYRLYADQAVNRLDLQRRLSAIQTNHLAWTAQPVFVDADAGLELIFNGHVLVKLKKGTDAAAFFGSAWPDTSPQTNDWPSWYSVSLQDRTAEAILKQVNRWANDSRVEWTEPVFLGEVGEARTTTDPELYNQWWVDQYGQFDAKTNFDARLAQAWDITGGGSNNIVIAILDDGVDLAHADLAANIYNNPGEVINGIDDDGNGYIDDVNGWNFATPNNNPNPVSVTGDEHGTACAGMAAAVGDNGVGVAGAAYSTQILPLKHSISNNFIASTGMAAAVRYAAGLNNAGAQVWRGADVLSMSFTLSASIAVSNALDFATANGRGGRGTVCLAAAGNNGSGQRGYRITFQMTNFPSGEYILRLEYLKDNTGSNGLDTVWISGLSLPVTNAALQIFEEPGLPAGWATGGSAPFTVDHDPDRQMGWGLYNLKSGQLTDNQNSWVQTPQYSYAPGTSPVIYAWVDTQLGFAPRTYPATPLQGDTLWARFFHVGNGTWSNVLIDCGIPGNQWWSSSSAVQTNVGFPASHPNVIAVGGSTDQGYRYAGSQYGTDGPDFVAPTWGGLQGVRSTDISGALGYNNSAGADGDYTYFSGTSASTPLAAGVAGLLLSVNTNLTWQQVRQRLQNSAEKIGPAPYLGETNVWYGHGKISAYNALLSNSVPTLSSMQTETVRNTRVYLSADVMNVSNGYEIVSPGDVTFRAVNRINVDETFHAATGSTYRALIRANP